NGSCVTGIFWDMGTTTETGPPGSAARIRAPVMPPSTRVSKHARPPGTRPSPAPRPRQQLRGAQLQCYAASMKNAHLAQLAFAVVAAVGVYSFLTSARDGERRRLCTPACSLRPNYANTNRTAPDFELPTLDGSTKKLSD